MSKQPSQTSPGDKPRTPKRLGPAWLVVFWILVVVAVTVGGVVSAMLGALNIWDGIGLFLSVIGLIISLLTRRSDGDYAWIVGMLLSVAGLLVLLLSIINK